MLKVTLGAIALASVMGAPGFSFAQAIPDSDVQALERLGRRALSEERGTGEMWRSAQETFYAGPGTTSRLPAMCFESLTHEWESISDGTMSLYKEFLIGFMMRDAEDKENALKVIRVSIDQMRGVDKRAHDRAANIAGICERIEGVGVQANNIMAMTDEIDAALKVADGHVGKE